MRDASECAYRPRRLSCAPVGLAGIQSRDITAHEEGGFILRNADATLSVERWPRGVQKQISVPEHSDGKRNGLTIIATFHTHPNPGADFLQGPSLTDIRAVRNDSGLGHADTRVSS